MNRHGQRTSLLCLLLALCLLPSAALMEAVPPDAPSEYLGRRLVDAGQQLNSLVVLDGVGYALTETALYVVHPGDREARLAGQLTHAYRAAQMNEPSVDVLMVQDNKLLGLNRHNGILYELAVDAQGIRFTERLRLDWSPFIVDEGESTYTEVPTFTLLDQGRLYLKLQNYSNDKQQDLYSYDLQNGTLRKHTPRHLNTFIPYKDGKLLCMYYDQNKQDPKTGRQIPAAPMLFDPEADSAEPIGLRLLDTEETRYAGMLLHYDAATDRLYASNPFGIYLIRADQAPQMVARLPMAGARLVHYGNMLMQPIGNQELLVGYGRHLFRRSTDPAQLKPVTSLTVNLSMLRPEALTLSLIQNEDLELKPAKEDWPSNETVAQQFLTREMELDVMVAETGTHDLQRLMQKGYLVPLDQDPQLKAIGECLYPAFQPVTQHEGRLYALPVRLDSSFNAYHPERFQELKLEVPASLDELIDFVDWWAKEGASQHPDYALFEESGARQTLNHLVYEQYRSSHYARQQPLKFDEAGFGAMMKRIEAIDFEAFDLDPASLGDEDLAMMPGKPLITPYYGYNMEYNLNESGNMRMYQLPLKTGDPEYHHGRSSVLVIPATSQKQELALRFIRSYVNNMSLIDQAAISADWDQPIPNPNYEQELKNLEDSKASYEKLHAAAEEGAAKRQYAADIQNMQKALERTRLNRRYILSEQGIRDHRAFMASTYFDDSMSLTQDSALSEDGYLFHLYGEGTLSLEQFMQQANDKIRLMTLEMQ